MFLGAVFCITKNQLYHKNTSCPFSNLRPMLVLQVHRSGNLLQLQNLLVFFDGLSPVSRGAALYACVIVLLCDCVIVVFHLLCRFFLVRVVFFLSADSNYFVSVFLCGDVFSFLCCYKTARLCCCICFLNNYAVTIKMSLCVCAIVFLCRVSCQRVLLYFCANEYSNTEYRTSTSTRPHNCATRCAFRLVRQTKGRFPKTGKKCFCRTTAICRTNYPAKNTLPLRESSSKVAYFQPLQWRKFSLV